MFFGYRLQRFLVSCSLVTNSDEVHCFMFFGYHLRRVALFCCSLVTTSDEVHCFMFFGYPLRRVALFCCSLATTSDEVHCCLFIGQHLLRDSLFYALLLPPPRSCIIACFWLPSPTISCLMFCSLVTTSDVFLFHVLW